MFRNSINAGDFPFVLVATGNREFYSLETRKFPKNNLF